MPPKSERRYAIDGWQSVDFQVRATEDGDGMTFEGYAAVFDVDSDAPIPGFGLERIAKGAFKRSLGMKRDIKMFLNHNSDLVLASRDGGTLELAEDDIGLKVQARLIDTTAGLDTAKNIRAGNVSTMSFGFTPDEFKSRKDGVEGVVHTRVALWEVSPVTSWPAYSATSASVRHLASVIDADEEPVAEALRVLFESDDPLSLEQRDLIVAAINARTDQKIVVPEVAAVVSRVQSRLDEFKELTGVSAA
jgi:HK97 family phage prohead protease